MSISTQLASRSSNQPLGAGGNQRRRFLLHHLPLALTSAVVLVLVMSLPVFDANLYPHGDIVSGTFPQQARGDDIAPTGHRGGHSGPMRHGRDHAAPMHNSGSKTLTVTASTNDGRHQALIRQFTVVTGYAALGFLALTLLIGPANLLLHKRNPVSNYLRRDVGAWTASFSVVHVIFGLQLHGGRGGQISRILNYFIAADGRPLTNSFGLGNWTGLAAVVIVVALLATSSDAALRKLKARPWKWLQRLNYPLFALVILHAFFYGALLRLTSPYTLLLALSVIAVFVGQVVGVWLWRRNYARTAATAV